MRIAIAMVLSLVIGSGQSAYRQTQSTHDPRVADIVQSGKLRIGVFPSFQYSKDASGKPEGLALGIANALAAGMGIGVPPGLFPNTVGRTNDDCA
jgi:ABC-type amino acid transport substrate-binding protein